jgi:hypothetical protein
MYQIYQQLSHTVSWFQIKKRMQVIAELESIRVIKAGEKVHPILYDIYDVPRYWGQYESYPFCDMV